MNIEYEFNNRNILFRLARALDPTQQEAREILVDGQPLLNSLTDNDEDRTLFSLYSLLGCYAMILTRLVYLIETDSINSDEFVSSLISNGSLTFTHFLFNIADYLLYDQSKVSANYPTRATLDQLTNQPNEGSYYSIYASGQAAFFNPSDNRITLFATNDSNFQRHINNGAIRIDPTDDTQITPN